MYSCFSFSWTCQDHQGQEWCPLLFVNGPRWHLSQHNQLCVFPPSGYSFPAKAECQRLIPQTLESPDHQARPPAGCTLCSLLGVGMAAPGSICPWLCQHFLSGR